MSLFVFLIIISWQLYITETKVFDCFDLEFEVKNLPLGMGKDLTIVLGTIVVLIIIIIIIYHIYITPVSCETRSQALYIDPNCCSHKGAGASSTSTDTA